jgi:hypothetical protein
MKRFIAALLCLFLPTVAFAADNSYKVSYDGGSISDIKAGSSANLVIEQTQVRLAKDKKDLVAVPAAAITEISYGQDVHRRIGTAIGLAVVSLGIGALMAFSKSKKHFIGITYADGDKKGGFVIQCDKNEYRGILAALEGITGKKVVDSDAMTVKN